MEPCQKLPKYIKGKSLLSSAAPKESLWENAFGRRHDPTDDFQKDVTGKNIKPKN